MADTKHIKTSFGTHFLNIIKSLPIYRKSKTATPERIYSRIKLMIIDHNIFFEIGNRRYKNPFMERDVYENPSKVGDFIMMCLVAEKPSKKVRWYI